MTEAFRSTVMAKTSHDAEICADPERCYKCLRYANRVMQDAAQKLLDKNDKLRAQVAELSDVRKRYIRQVAYLAGRVRELEAKDNIGKVIR